MNSDQEALSISSIQVGSRLGKYVILSELGRGGMAIVFKAHQPDLDRLVAIKVLFGVGLQQRFIERFQAEARSVAKMNHPNVIRIFEVGEQNGAHYLVMELIEDNDLLAFLHERKPSFNEVVEIVYQIAQALAYCHSQGIIHRDLKPTNILMRGTIPVVIDFGLAKAVDPNLDASLTLSGEVVGSPAYMSSEQAQGQIVGTHSDICSLGIIMYELISFKNPYLDPRSLHQTALNAIKAEPVPIRYLSPWLDEDFAAIVNTCLAKEIGDRYQSMELVLKDLHSFRNGLPILAKPPSALNLAWRFIKANPILYTGTAFILILAALIYAFITIQEQNAKSPWGLVQEETFDKTDSSLKFQSYDKFDNLWTPSQTWKISDGHLTASSIGQSFVVANQEFFGDLKIEFTVKGLRGSNNDFNAFIFGSTPEDAFRFSLGEGGSSIAKIEYGKPAAFPFNTRPVNLNSDIAYKVGIVKEKGVLQLSLNDTVLVRQYYTLPIKVERSSKFGFYSLNSNLEIDDLRIYKKAVALSAKPTVVADAYLEEGFITNSIPAYKHVIDAYPNKNISYEAHMKMGESFMVLKNYPQAISNLTLTAANSTDSKVIPEALFHLAQCYFDQGMMKEGFDKLKLIPGSYPESEFNNVLVHSRVQAIYRCLDGQENPEVCAARMVEEFKFLIQYEDSHRDLFGAYYVDLVEIFRRIGQFGPPQNAEHIVDYFQENIEIKQGLQLTLARYHAGWGNLIKAQHLISEVPLGENLSQDFKTERRFLDGQIAFLNGKNSKAAEEYQNLFREYSNINGMPFKCLIHSLVIKCLVDIPTLQPDPKILVNDAVSNKERLQYAFLFNPASEDFFHQEKSAYQGKRLSLEDALVNFVKIHSKSTGFSLNSNGSGDGTNLGSLKAANYLLSVLPQFYPHTFERFYLEFLLKRYKEEKRV